MVSVAVVGTGGMGKIHLSNLAHLANVRVTAVCDCNAASAEIAEALHAAFYNDLNEMLGESDADAVVVCTPTYLHYEQAALILKAKKHCISEKPLCLKYEQAQKLYALAEENGRLLFVGHVLHFFPEYEKLTDLVRSGEYGEAVDGYFFRLSEKPAWITGNWLFDREKSGLIPFDLHIHEAEYLISLFGVPTNYRRQGSGGNMQDDHYRFLLTYPDRTVCAEASWYEAPIPFTYGFRVYFEKALVSLFGTQLVAYEKGTRSPKVLYEAPPVQEKNGINVGVNLPYLREMEHFIRCIEENHPSDIITSGNVLNTIRIIENLQD